MATKYTSLPKTWSNKGVVEKLREDAAASASRAFAAAVADTGTNFALWDGLRTREEQIALFVKNYRNTGRTTKTKATDRFYAGTVWARRTGSVAVASPDLGSNHQSGVAMDLHPAAIQAWFKDEGRKYGWSWAEGQRNGEDWHFRYFPENDQMNSWGPLDHAWVQKVVGATVDGKIGTGTVAKIKAWQKANGLTADGKVGPQTKAKMQGGKTTAASKPAVSAKPAASKATAAYTIERHQTKNLRPGRVDEKRGLKGSLKAITLHHWGADGQEFDNVVSWLVADGNGNNQSSAHEVIEGGRVAVLASIEDGTWNTGDPQGNVDNYALECRPEADEATVQTVIARVAAVRAEAGWNVPLDVHRDYTATACPGRYVALRDRIDAAARYGKVAAPSKLKPAPVVKLAVDGDFGPATAREVQSRLGVKVDGRVGANTVTAWQRHEGTPADGKISGQPKGVVSGHSGVVSSVWEYGDGGSALVKAVQRNLNYRPQNRLTVDGILGPNTVKALQAELNTNPGALR